jgi:hypothetical protein
MSKYDIREHSLFPNDTELNDWQKCVKDAIIEVHSRWAPYAWTAGHGGVSQDLYFRDKRLLNTRPESKGGPASYCCGATFEVFATAWKKWYSELEGKENLSWSQMNEIRKYFFCIKTEDRTYDYGAQDGIGEYLYDELDWINTETYEDPEVVPFGTFVQFQFRRDPQDSGHSAIVLGTGKVKNKKAVLVWSSNNYYDTSWEHSKGQKPGHGFDYYYLNKVVDGFKREFHMATIIPPGEDD